MSSIDTRVVEAKFDNRQFQQGVKETSSSLNDLKKNLNMDGATKGLTGMSAAVEKVSRGFSVMRVAAYTAVATIAHQLTIAGEQLVKSFTVGPLLDGLHEYETQLNSVQTILSNTQWEHSTLKDVNKALNELNHYSDKTIYNFSEMARNVGTFTAAGVKLKTSVAAIKGIANLAAVSGSNSQQASTAMYQLSQAISSGTVKLMDWNSVVNAGMGGKVFQDALKETARVHGVNIDHMIKKEGSFRNTLQNGWLTSKILTQTLNNFTGDVSRAQLKQMGYTDKQIEGILKMGKVATDAATKVKTFTQLMGTLKEAAGSGWAKTWQLIIGNFNQAKSLWTNVSNVLGGMIQNSAKARNSMLKDWAAAGGRTALIDAFANAFKALMAVIKPIKDAFREVFPAKTGQQLADMTKSLRDFMANLKIGADTANNLKRTFAGVFAVLDIGWQIIKAGIHFIADLFGAITKGEGSGGFLGATANIGDFLVALDKAIKKGQGFTKFFNGLVSAIAPVIAFIKRLVDSLLGVSNFSAPSADKITKAFNPIANFGKLLSAVWSNLLGLMGKVFSFAQKVGETVGKVMLAITHAITGAFHGVNYEDILHTINTGLLAGLLLLFKKFVDHFRSGAASPFSSLVEAIKSPLEGITGTLSQMQKTLRATTLLEIAAAIGIMTLSVIGLSKIDAAGLTRALTAMTAMFVQLFGSLIVFERVGGAKGLFATSAGLIVFATALRILTSSVKALSELSWGELAKGLVGVTALIGGLILATRGIGGQAGGMIRAGAGLLLLAAGIKVLVSSVTDLSGLSWGQMAKGLVGVAALLGSLAIFTKLVEANRAGVLQGAGLVLLATGIKILASATQDFGSMAWGGIAKGLVSIGAILAIFTAFSKGVGNPITLVASSAALIGIGIAMNILAKAMGSFGNLDWGQIAKGLLSMAGALTVIVLAMNAMPATSVLSAAALIGVSIALLGIGKALSNMGDMSWGEIAKGLVTLAGALTIIILAVAGMEEGLPGAAALLVVAAALRILTPVLTTLGSMSWGEIAKGLVVLAAALTIIGVAGVLLTPIVPTLLGLGAAVLLLGVGMAAAGAGVLLFATGLTALAAAGAAGTAAIVGIVMGLVGLLPTVAKELGLAVEAFAVVIGKAGPAILKAIAAVLDAFLGAITKEEPKIIKTFGKLVVDMVNKVAEVVPKMAAAALRLILGVLQAVDNNAPKIVHAVAKMLIDILNAMANETPKMVTAAVNLIVAFLEGIAKNLGRIINAGADIVIAVIKGIGKSALKIANAAMDTIIAFANGLAKAINTHVAQFRTAGLNIAFAIANGMTMGLAGKAKDVAQSAINVAKGAVSGVGHFLHIRSPSKVFYKLGWWSGTGFANGLNDTVKASKAAGENISKSALEGASKEFRDAAKYVMKDLPGGLVGGRDEVKQTIQDTSNVLHAAVQKSHQDMQQLKQDIHDLTASRKDDDKAVRDASNAVEDAQAKLTKLQNAKKQDHEANVRALQDLNDAKDKLAEAKKARNEHEQAIKDDTAALAKATDEHARAKLAFDDFNASMDAHKARLIELGKQYDAYTVKIDAAKKALDDAIATEKSYNDQIVQQYSALPDISADTTVEGYTTALTDQVDNTQTFTDDLNALRNQFKLSDDLYKELLAKGPAILPFVEQLLAGGQAAVDQLNTLTAQLDAEAKVLGSTASKALYQAGVDTAQGLLNGLESKRDKIEKKMQSIADAIAREIRKALKIKSPSQVMHEIGQQIGQGLVNGMESMESDIDKQGKKLVDKMNAYIQQLNAMLAEAETLTPKITPVLDLSQVKKDAAKIKAVATPTISVGTAFATASRVAAGVQTATAPSQPVPTQSNSTVTFVQNNTSPKALSSAEIYRLTNNQLSLAKGALTPSAT